MIDVEEEKSMWQCSVCGALLEDTDAPDYCPICQGEDIFFIKVER